MKLKMLVELDYDGERMHGGTIEGSAWFFNDMLKDDVLTLHSNDIGDTIGEIKILSFIKEEETKRRRPMKITKITMYPQEELIRRLREVTLTDGVTKPYAESEIKIQNYFYFGWENLKFAQRYVLKSDYKKIEELYEAIRDLGIHPLSLNTFYEITLDTGDTFPFIPPIIEWTPEDGYYVADGMHRMDYCSRNFNYRDYGGNPNVIIIKNPSAPYYALPCDLTWETLPMVNERPEVRKIYRDPDNYKALFRDYNSQFPGIQRDRSKDK